MEKIEFEGLKNCYRIYNDTVDLIAPTEIGPSILRFGFVGEKMSSVLIRPIGVMAHIVSGTHLKRYLVISRM